MKFVSEILCLLCNTILQLKNNFLNLYYKQKL